MRLIFTITALTLLAAWIGFAAEPKLFEDLQSQAKAAYSKGKPDEAVALASRAIAVEPQNPRGYFLRARFHEENREPARAMNGSVRSIYSGRISNRVTNFYNNDNNGLRTNLAPAQPTDKFTNVRPDDPTL